MCSRLADHLRSLARRRAPWCSAGAVSVHIVRSKHGLVLSEGIWTRPVARTGSALSSLRQHGFRNDLLLMLCSSCGGRGSILEDMIHYRTK